jgi:hypothetical protein
MPQFCTETDCTVIYEDWQTLVGAAGTTGTTIIAAASDWVQATMLDFFGTVLYESGTNYPYWIKQSTALESIYLALQRRMNQGQESSTGFWEKYHTDSLAILTDIRDSKHVLVAQDIAEWERGIGPAVPNANGTIAAGVFGMLQSNQEKLGAWFTGDRTTTYLFQIDGVGSKISQQTFKWQYKYGSTWQDEGIALNWGWIYIDNGLEIRFEDRGTFAAGQQWEVTCGPNQGRVSGGVNIQSWQMTRTF